MIAAMAQAGAAFDNQRYIHGATAAADFILQKMALANRYSGPARSIRRRASQGISKTTRASSMHWSSFIRRLSKNAGSSRHCGWHRECSSGSHAPEGGFYSTSNEHAHLIARNKDHYDGSTPSGNAMAATALLRLGKLTDRRDLLEAGAKTLQAFSSLLAESSGGSSQMLSALDFHLGPIKEIVVVGREESSETRRVLGARWRRLTCPTLYFCITIWIAGMRQPI